MPKPKDEALRQKLIEAATGEFADLGYAGASMDGIGGRAGVTKGGVYFHFRSKEELFFAALDHWHGQLREVVPGPTGRGLREFLVDYLGFHFRHPEAASLLRVLATELRGRFVAQVREDLRNAQRSLRSRIRDLLIAGAQDGRLFTTDPAFAAFVLACSVEGVLHHWLGSPQDSEAFLDPEALADFLLAPFDTGRGDRQAGPGVTAAEGADFLPPL